MTALRAVILSCDIGRCRSTYRGATGELVADVRRRAKSIGWKHWTTVHADERVEADQCPRHR